MFKIGLIVCYYGDFPDYFPLWLESCSRNTMLEFFFVTDSNIEKYNIPANVHILKESFEELKKRFQRLFDFKISLNTPYKLCDYKAVYGDAFENELKGYDFFGYCDIDLIFGDVSKFLSEEILQEYEKIFLYGHFMLYKNNDKMRKLYKEKGGYSYREVFSSDLSYAFDEMFGMNLIARENKVNEYKGSFCKDIPYTMYGMISGKADMKEEIYYKDKNSVCGAYLQNDEIICEEYMYIHFSKKRVSTSFDSEIIPDSYYISVNGCRERLAEGKPEKMEIIINSDYVEGINKNKLRVKWKLNRLKSILHSGNINALKVYINNSIYLMKNKRMGL